MVSGAGWQVWWCNISCFPPNIRVKTNELTLHIHRLTCVICFPELSLLILSVTSAFRIHLWLASIGWIFLLCSVFLLHCQFPSSFISTKRTQLNKTLFLTGHLYWQFIYSLCTKKIPGAVSWRVNNVTCCIEGITHTHCSQDKHEKSQCAEVIQCEEKKQRQSIDRVQQVALKQTETLQLNSSLLYDWTRSVNVRWLLWAKTWSHLCVGASGPRGSSSPADHHTDQRPVKNNSNKL